MSRVGKTPIDIPSGVEINRGAGGQVTVKGPKGSLQMTMRPEIDLSIDGAVATVEPKPEAAGESRASAFHGLTRALISNMVEGVTKGYEKQLEIIGVGWNAQAQGQKLVLNIGFCHPVNIDMPQGVSCETPSPTSILIKGIDKQAVGQTAAVIRKVRPPEPYKGKGIRYKDEYVRRKAGKSFGS